MITLAEFSQDAAACLHQGGTVVLPTDTVVGLAALPEYPLAVDQIYALKARSRQKNLPIMVADAAQMDDLGAQITSSATALLASDYMPGPLTLVLELDPLRAPKWLQGRTEIAVRIPAHEGLRALLRLTGPLVVTSANISGETPASNSADAARLLTALPDMCITGDAGGDVSSTLIDCNGKPTILRHGAVSASEIAEILEVL